jgi:hypothetical protein
MKHNRLQLLIIIVASIILVVVDVEALLFNGVKVSSSLGIGLVFIMWICVYLTRSRNNSK